MNCNISVWRYWCTCFLYTHITFTIVHSVVVVLHLFWMRVICNHHTLKMFMYNSLDYNKAAVINLSSTRSHTFLVFTFSSQTSVPLFISHSYASFINSYFTPNLHIPLHTCILPSITFSHSRYSLVPTIIDKVRPSANEWGWTPCSSIMQDTCASYTPNIRGPITDPWGTPPLQVVVAATKKSPFKYCWQPFKQDANQSVPLWLIRNQMPVHLLVSREQ